MGEIVRLDLLGKSTVVLLANNGASKVFWKISVAVFPGHTAETYFSLNIPKRLP